MKSEIVIIGAGGHGKVVCDAIIAQGEYNVAGFVDDTLAVGDMITSKYKVIATQNNIHSLNNVVDYFIVAIGNNQVREKAYNTSKQYFKPATVIHPSAVIGSNVKIGTGTIVLANAVINSSSNVGENTIVNTGVIIDHDSIIGNHIRLSIGTLVGSNSEIADYYTSSIGDKINSFSKI